MRPRPAPAPPGVVTRLLQAWSNGDPSAHDELIPFVYKELRRRAAAHLRRERRDHTLQPTDLVHEAYIRLCAQSAGWKNREQFFAMAARLMRRILVDHARARGAGKRRRELRITLSEEVPVTARLSQPDVIALDQALDELSSRDERQGRLVELRFFGGLTQSEAATALGVSLATADRDWAHARAWLYRRLHEPSRMPAHG